MEYRNPKPTVDVIVECGTGIVLIKRANPPYGWALPGGFVDEWEKLEDAARREILEETHLDVELTDLLYAYSDPTRDPRQHTISVVFVGKSSGSPVAGDDAAEAAVFPMDELPAPLAFDHAEIIADYRRFKATGQRPDPGKNSA